MKRLPLRLSLAQKAVLIALAFLYIAFLSMDWLLNAKAGLADKLKYCAMLLVFALCALSLPKAHDRRGGLLLLGALALTLIADCFLLFTRRFALGVGAFCFAQCLHAGRLRKKLLLPLLLITGAALAVAALIINDPRRLYFVAGLYALLFLTAFSLSFFAKGVRAGLLRWGYVLFLLCDIHVALHHVLSGAPYAQTAQKLIWLFYLPSQVLLALSNRSN